MHEDVVREKVREVVAEMAPLQGERVSSSSLLEVDLGYDSLGVLECVSVIEQEFELSDTGEEGIAIETVRDIEEVVLGVLRGQRRLEVTADA